MSKKLAGFIKQVEIISQEIEESFHGLSNEQLNWKPSPKSWSIAQCLEHLVITNDLYFENIQKVADGTHRNNFYSMIPFVPGITGAVMKKVLNPDFRMKVKTMGMFKPSFSSVSENILGVFANNQERFIGLIEATKDLDVKSIKVAEPVGAAINLRLVDAFEILIVHEKRHFNQAKRVMVAGNFPQE